MGLPKMGVALQQGQLTSGRGQPCRRSAKGLKVQAALKASRRPEVILPALRATGVLSM